jgi:hypothetical protein
VQGSEDVGAGGPEVGVAVVSWKYSIKVTVIEASVIKVKLITLIDKNGKIYFGMAVVS